MKRTVSVSVPASSGNIGPGFDVLGMALSLRNELHVRVLNSKPGQPVIRIAGQGEQTLPTDSTNVIYKTMRAVFTRARRKMPQLELVCVNRIPLARGLGSSSAAYLSALLAANRLIGNSFSPAEILDWASSLEGHPDNVAPAFLGGVRASGVYQGKVFSALLPSPRTALVVAIPDFELSTKKARRALPQRVPLKDAVFNLSAVALLPSAFSGDGELLKDLLNDRLHEPYRAKLVPGFAAVKKAALQAGALGVILSGAGPTMLSFVRPNRATPVAEAMQQAFLDAGVRSRNLKLAVDKKGAIVS